MPELLKQVSVWIYLLRHIVCPEFALTHNSFNGIFALFRRILVFLEKPFDHLSHSRAGGFFLLSVNRAIFAKHFGQLPRQSNQGFIFVEILDVFRFCQCVIEGQFLFR